MSQRAAQVKGIEIPSESTWRVDPGHSSVGFTARYVMLSKVRGSFGTFEGAIHVGDTPEESWVEGTIDAASIDSAQEMRDDHLRSPDFLDVERYPKLSFRSTKIEPARDGRFRVTGDLTIKDVTRPVVLDVEFEGSGIDAFGKERIAFSARTEINREEFGITWNKALDTGGVLVGPKIGIEIDVQAIRETGEQQDA